MLKKQLLILLLGAVIFTFNKCSNDVDLYADYKDITIVYGILDISDDTTWVKVTRAFSGPGDALFIAKNPDSSNYPYKLDLTLTGRKQGDDLTPIQFDTITINNKKEGDSIFYFPNQLMYYATANLDVDANYTLAISNVQEQITSETPLINSFVISTPRNRINFDTDNVKFEWTAPKNAKRFEVYYVFNFQELLPGTTDTANRSMQWVVGPEVADGVEGGEKIESTGYDGNRFYQQLENELPDENEIPGIQRWAGKVDVFVASGSQELHNYISINSFEGSLLEEVPIYSNIENGYGIFAARHTTIKSVDLTTGSLGRLVSMDLGFLLPTK